MLGSKIGGIGGSWTLKMMGNLWEMGGWSLKQENRWEREDGPGCATPSHMLAIIHILFYCLAVDQLTC